MVLVRFIGITGFLGIFMVISGYTESLEVFWKPKGSGQVLTVFTSVKGLDISVFVLSNYTASDWLMSITR